MPVRRTLDQERAEAAWDAVRMVQPRAVELRKDYRALARGFAAMVQLNGLGAACAFLYAKSKTDAKNSNAGMSEGETAHALLLDHLGTWLGPRFTIPADQSLIEWLTSTSSDEYRRATVETLAYLLWLRRFAEGGIVVPEQVDGDVRQRGGSPHGP